MKKAILLLEDGKTFSGESFGYEGETTGEVVFNTSITGYQEILTDPSYKGQIVTMTYPHIGNYGTNQEDIESAKPHIDPAPFVGLMRSKTRIYSHLPHHLDERCGVEGFVVREYSKIYSNWRARKSLGEFLKQHHVVALEGVDTRALVRHIREKGAMRGIISTEDFNEQRLVEKACSSPKIIGRDLVNEVTCSNIYEFNSQPSTLNSQLFKVVVMDFGVKLNILRSLVAVGLHPIIVPAKTSFEKILSLKPSGILLSNGPGDPEAVPYAIETVKQLICHPSSVIRHLPLFGICLGHQILGLATGAKTYKLKFGHRGANQPIKNLLNGRVEITSENHGFAVDKETLNDFKITHINLNDGTLEGMEHKTLPIFSVQFHPEASPGPHDTKYLFEKFLSLIKSNYAKKN